MRLVLMPTSAPSPKRKPSANLRGSQPEKRGRCGATGGAGGRARPCAGTALHTCSCDQMTKIRHRKGRECVIGLATGQWPATLPHLVEALWKTHALSTERRNWSADAWLLVTMHSVWPLPFLRGVARGRGVAGAWVCGGMRRGCTFRECSGKQGSAGLLCLLRLLQAGGSTARRLASHCTGDRAAGQAPARRPELRWARVLIGCGCEGSAQSCGPISHLCMWSTASCRLPASSTVTSGLLYSCLRGQQGCRVRGGALCVYQRCEGGGTSSMATVLASVASQAWCSSCNCAAPASERAPGACCAQQQRCCSAPSPPPRTHAHPKHSLAHTHAHA
jgi:hypothetical protein